ncbi:MAG: porin [Herbaspirillum sp.]
MQHTHSRLKKVLLAAAVGALFAAPAFAQTNVTVSGTVDAFAGSMRMAGDANSKAVLNSGGMTTPWLGFKGTEDLGGGLKANFALTTFLQVDTGVQGRFPGDTLFSRDANVGLSGGFGAVTLGRGLAPHFLPTILFNPFGDSYTFSPLILHTDVPIFNPNFTTRWSAPLAATDTGWSNEIIYTTPNFGGLTANVHYQFGEQAGDSGKNNVGANLLYFNGPLSLTAFYENSQMSNPQPTVLVNRSKTWFIGGGYDLKVVKLFATYQKASLDNIDQNAKTWSLGASAPMGAGKILAAYAQTKADVPGSSAKRSTASLGYDYNLSKRTDLYAIYMNDRITDLDTGNSFGVGIRHQF